jgi:hyperosmotically inducible protein
MHQYRIPRLLAIAALAATLGACADHEPEQRNTAQYTDDTTLNTNVQTAVLGVPGVHANDLQVSTYDGVVKLRGKVDSQMAAQNAIQAARQVQGVKKVDYDIDVGNQ